MRTISFMSANYVARALNYNGLEDWGAHDRATVQWTNADTFAAMLKDVADAGFDHIDIWQAHCHYQHHNRDDFLEQAKGILSQYDFTIASYAYGIGRESREELEKAFKFVKQLGAPIVAGGVFGADPAEVVPVISEICQQYNILYAFENHPEKTVDEIFTRMGRGQYKNVGVALDTGWCGSSGIDALEAAKQLREHLTVVHLKDVTAAGRHDTCALGDGIVPVEKVVRYLVDSNWQGDISIEHEPYDRDPMPEVKTSLQRLKQWLS
jgi:L-ribulose-5-phosphate 3-epimerase